MLRELLMAVVMISLHRRSLMVRFIVFAVRPGVTAVCEAVLDVVVAAAEVEHVGHVSGGQDIGAACWVAELNAVVGQHRVDLVGNRGD
jgi:hypothetical protein